MGELLIEANLISRDDLGKALRFQVGGNRRLGYLLIKMGFITEQQLHSVLSQQMDLPIVSIADEFSNEAKKILPQYLCRKYSVVPLSLGENNTLKMAMVDPSDFEAVADIERYTGKVIHPVLAPKSEIITGIRNHIPWTLKDILNTQNTGRLTVVIAAVTLLLVGVVTVQFYQEKMQQKYGKITKTPQTTSYENLELILGFTSDNKITLLGRGKYSSGYYSVTFSDPKFLKSFINSRKRDFSENQLEWLSWAMTDPHKNK